MQRKRDCSRDGERQVREGGGRWMWETPSPPLSLETAIPCACGPWIDSSFLSFPPPSPSAPGRRPRRGPWFCGAAWLLAPWCRCYCCCYSCCYSYHRCSSPPLLCTTTSRPCFLFLCPSVPQAPSLTTSSLVACVRLRQAMGTSVSR